MGWVEDLHGKTVGLDTAPLIFYIEDNDSEHDYAEFLAPFFESVDRGEIQIVTSVLTLLEVLVQPLRHNDEALASHYNDILLSSPHILTISVTQSTVQLAAELRADNKLKTPDAIHVATAIAHQADAFLTNDRDFKDVASISILKVKELYDSHRGS